MIFLANWLIAFPEKGIVFVHHNAFRVHKTPLKPNRKLLLICLKAEARPYPFAQLHVVQNPTEFSERKKILLSSSLASTRINSP